MGNHQYGPRGELLDVDGRKMHVHSMGQETPSVVLEAGGASWSMDWSLVQPELAKHTTVVAYDRAGLGWSESGPLPRTAARMAVELASLLENARVPKPYLLVGASFGGHVVRLFARARPADVAGLVLLDARHEDIDARLPPSWKKLVRAGATGQRILGVAARWRLLPVLGAVMGQSGLPPIVSKLPEGLKEEYLQAGFQARSFEANLSELHACDQSDREVSGAGALGSLPLTVIRHGVPDLFRAMSDADATAAEVAWVEMQGELARLSTQASVLVAEGSGHAIQVARPDLVISAVLEMLATARARAIPAR